MGFRRAAEKANLIVMPSVPHLSPEMHMKIVTHTPMLRLAFVVALFVPLAQPGAAQEADLAKRQAEADTAKADLAEHPKFKKFYDHLKAHPETISSNGPKLAAILWQEANENKTIRDDAPSLTAALQEVERLARAGQDTKLALQAIDAQVAQDAELMPDSKARQMKALLIADAARSAAEPRAKPQDRAETRAWVEELLTDAIDANDERVVEQMLAAQLPLAKSSTERMNVAVALLVTADEQLQTEKANIAARLVDHVGEMLKNATASKGRKEATDALAVLKSRVAIAHAADAARRTLATDPADPAANQAIGMNLLVNRGDWRQAILHLALGADEAWQKLAADTVALPKDGKSKAALAERWAALEMDRQAPGRQVARDLFTEALADQAFVGFSRAAAEEKLKALGPAEAQKVAAKPEQKKPELTKPERTKPKVTGKSKAIGPAVITATNRKAVVGENDEQYPLQVRGGVTKYDWVDPPKPGEADVSKGAIEFKVDETGVLYLMGSWGSQGNNGGGWADERVMPEGLVALGWEPVGKHAGDENSGIFRKLVTKGESYRIRVNKYAPPVLFTPLPPEPK
jgi:hypothetical protein